MLLLSKCLAIFCPNNLARNLSCSYSLHRGGEKRKKCEKFPSLDDMTQIPVFSCNITPFSFLVFLHLLRLRPGERIDGDSILFLDLLRLLLRLLLLLLAGPLLVVHAVQVRVATPNLYSDSGVPCKAREKKERVV